MRVELNPTPEDINNLAKHRLYVEGETDDSFDVNVVKEILRTGSATISNLSIKSLRCSLSIRSCAAALRNDHPYYYFVIDRDYHNSDEIEKSWTTFMDEESPNLLIWHYNELENYFLQADYIAKSSFLKGGCSVDNLHERIKLECSNRVYMDLSNRVIIRLRNDLNDTWITKFTDPSLFTDESSAINTLIGLPHFSGKVAQVQNKLTEAVIRDEFEKIKTQFFGSSISLEYGSGEWLNLIDGKEILHIILNQCFLVRNGNREVVQGNEALRIFARELISNNTNAFPTEFNDLKRLLEDKINQTIYGRPAIALRPPAAMLYAPIAIQQT